MVPGGGESGAGVVNSAPVVVPLAPMPAEAAGRVAGALKVERSSGVLMLRDQLTGP